MSDAPEQIWADNYSGKTGEGYWRDEPLAFLNGGTQYVRADLAALPPAMELVEALVKAADEAAEALDYSANEIANLENVLSDYRQNDATARDAAAGLRAALAAIRAGGKP
jgi:hypothetical protein